MSLKSIEGLRGLAALSVVVHHFYNATKTESFLPVGIGLFCQNGLTIFFVLSGFLLWRPFAKSSIYGSPIRVKTYLLNRFLRIYPTYFAVLSIAWLLGLVLLQNQNGQLSFPKYGRFENPLMALSGYSLTNTYTKDFGLTGIGPAWSLTAEIGFYFAIPILWLIPKHAKSIRLSTWAPSAILIFIGGCSQVLIWVHHRGMTDQASWEASWGPTWSMVFERSFLAQAHFFGFGTAAATAAAYWSGQSNPPWPRSFHSFTGWGVVAFSVAMIVIEKNSPSIQCAFGALFAVYLSLHERQASKSFILDSGLIKYSGKVSYPIYLVHMPMLAFLHFQGVLNAHSAAQSYFTLCVLIAATLAFSSILHFAIEKPFLSLKRIWN